MCKRLDQHTSMLLRLLNSIMIKIKKNKDNLESSLRTWRGRACPIVSRQYIYVKVLQCLLLVPQAEDRH